MSFDYENQAIREQTKDGLVLYSSQCPDKKLDTARNKYGCRTALACVERGARVSNNGPCLGWREGSGPYQYINYVDVLSRSKNAACGLLAKGVAPGQDTRVGIFCTNRVEYVLLQVGCYCYSMVPVPLYDTLGLEAMVHVVNQCELPVVLCDSEARLKVMLDNKARMPSLRLLVSCVVASDDLAAAAEKLGVEIVPWTALEALGEKNEVTTRPSQPEDLLMIMYTSGTTGMPKGAMLYHDGFLMIVNYLYEYFSAKMGNIEGGESVFLSYLPLAHIFENLMQSCVFMAGGTVGFFRGDIRLLFEDIAALKPTIFASVPRLYNRIYDKVNAMIRGSRFKNYIFNVALEQKLEMFKQGKVTNSSFWDNIAFKQVQGMLGGRVKCLVTGSAPLSDKVTNFFKAVFGAHFIEGYGQTETHGVITLTFPDDPVPGHVGGPIPCGKVKLIDCPDLGYYSKNGEGEICMQGPQQFRGYFRNEAKTKETVDAEGWLHSGDIGRLNQNGSITVIDRVKHIFKLSQGEYVAPEQVEAIYVQCPAVAQFYLHGESLQSRCVGIAIPDAEVFPAWVKGHVDKDLTGDIPELCKDPRVVKGVLEAVQAVGKARGLPNFQQAAVLKLHPVPFSVANDLLTPTFKARRENLRKHFKDDVAELYKTLG